MIESSKVGHVFWLFGLSGAGKSTLADHLASQYRAHGTAVLTLDGDILRAGLSRGLGFTDDDRAENIRRGAETAKLGVNSGLCAVGSFITPLERHRQLAREIIGASHLSLIYVSAPLEICRQRDVKGLYAGASTGKVAQMTGLSSAFEIPNKVDLAIATGKETPEASAQRLWNFCIARLEPSPRR